MAQVPATFYLHSDKMSNLDDFELAFPVASQNDDALGNAAGTAYELTFEGYWNEKGEYWATEMAGVTLAAPIKL